MRKFIDRGFVLDDGLVFGDQVDDELLGEGEIRCRGGIVLTVRKVLEVLPGPGRAEPMVRTVEYKYNARLEGRGNILRYDSPHRHRLYHHKHVYDTFDSASHGTIEKTGEDWPTLGKVLEELEMWFFENHDQLSEG